MMMTAFGIGLIGMGWMGQVHSRSYSLVPQRFPHSGLRPRLIICSDNVAARAAQAQKMLGFQASSPRWQDVVEHPQVQIVNIAAPNHLHLEIVAAAAAAGKHIFCEKPVGRTPQETAEIERIARQAGILTFVGFNYRWAPLVMHAKKLIADGLLGDLTQYRGRFFSMYGSDPLGLLSWRFDKEQAGYGVLGDIMAHVIDMALLMSGPVKRVVSSAHTFIPQRPKPIPGKGTHYSLGAPGDPKGPVTNEDYVGALLEFENGAIATVITSFDIWGHHLPSIEIHGTDGSLGVPDPNRFDGLVQVRQSADSGWRDIQLTHTTRIGRGAGVADMAYAIQSGRPHRASGALAFHVLDIMQALEESAAQGVHIDINSTLDQPLAVPASLADGVLDE